MTRSVLYAPGSQHLSVMPRRYGETCENPWFSMRSSTEFLFSGISAVWPEGDGANPRGNVQAGVALDTERLQRDRAVRATDEHIGSGADPDRGARSHAGKV